MQEECRTWLCSHDSFCPYGSREATQLQCSTLPPPLWPLSAVAVPSPLDALVLEQSHELLKVCEHGKDVLPVCNLQSLLSRAHTSHSINPNRFMLCCGHATAQTSPREQETMQQTGTTWQWRKLR